jgi:hypothetical protein
MFDCDLVPLPAALVFRLLSVAGFGFLELFPAAFFDAVLFFSFGMTWCFIVAEKKFLPALYEGQKAAVWRLLLRCHAQRC